MAVRATVMMWAAVAPFGRLLSAPNAVLSALGLLRQIAENTETMAETTQALPRIERQLEMVAEATQALPKIRADMADVAKATDILPEMHERMGTIAGAMPVLVDVQKSLANMPQTVERLDAGVSELSETLDRLLVVLEELGTGVAHLHNSMGPVSRLAERFGGRRHE
jgi:DNA repair ATPase RecN